LRFLIDMDNKRCRTEIYLISLSCPSKDGEGCAKLEKAKAQSSHLLRFLIDMDNKRCRTEIYLISLSCPSKDGEGCAKLEKAKAQSSNLLRSLEFTQKLYMQDRNEFD
ncbi:hypothetical protein, partial [Staphylococcus coagulans]|uniref:hypothetical protein n=1 Tax=Staphylococcus coagulans TaxID=74706 RepID=UPI001C70EC87